MQQRLWNETEIVVDPAFFTSLRLHLPRIAGVRIQPKRGRAMNELTKFRADVELDLDTPSAAPSSGAAPLTAATLDDVRALLRHEPAVLRLADLVDARLAADLQAEALITGAPAQLSVAEIRAQLARSEAPTGIHPEALASVDPRYDVALSWPASRTRGRFDAELRHRTRAVMRPMPAEAPVGAVEPWGEFVHHAQPDAFDPEQVASFRRHLGRSLPDYMIPAQFVRVVALPTTASGKVDRKQLKPPAVKRSARPYVPPRTPTERAIAALWGEVMRVEKAGMDDGFLELGGHSLLAMRIVGRVKRELGVSVGLAVLMQGGTVAQFSADVERLRDAPVDDDDEGGLVAVARTPFRRSATGASE